LLQERLFHKPQLVVTLFQTQLAGLALPIQSALLSVLQLQAVQSLNH
jgi:transcriptional regulator of acetoin/glycerol metabolism